MTSPPLTGDQAGRRADWYARVRANVHQVLNPDGSGRLVSFNAPYREPVWMLPALYSGSATEIALADRVVIRFVNDDGNHAPPSHGGGGTGRDFNIFHSTILTHMLCRYGARASQEARQAMAHHARLVGRRFAGGAQPDYKHHGANDNMPTMATQALILGGQTLDDRDMIRHGVWNLHQMRRHLSRCAWLSEFNSSTYTAITLSNIAKVATSAHDAAIRDLARQIEARLWAEVLLHYHPGTFMQAGASPRCFAVDGAGHTHSLQVILWLVFGPQISGRDPIVSCWQPDGVEILHYHGQPWQNIAQYCDDIDAEFCVPEELAPLMRERRYPAILSGRTEAMAGIDNAGSAAHTYTFMDRSFSLGTVDVPFFGGVQSASLLGTFAWKSQPRSFRDAGTIFVKYLHDDQALGQTQSSDDGSCRAEKFVANHGWLYCLQKERTALLLATPNLSEAPFDTGVFKLLLAVSCHFGRVERSVIGGGVVSPGAQGVSDQVTPVSFEAGQVFVHVQPLLPTSCTRDFAVGWSTQNHYQVLELVNYRGPRRTFSRQQAAIMLSGLVLTIDDKTRHDSLEKFHRRYSAVRVQDYLFAGHRFVLVDRDDVQFEVNLTVNPFGVQTQAIDGRNVPRPVLESNQIQTAALPFMSGPVDRNSRYFPWESLAVSWYPDLTWMVGSRGVEPAGNYSQRREDLQSLITA